MAVLLTTILLFALLLISIRFSTFPFSFLVFGYFIYFAAGNLFGFSGTNATLVYWIIINLLSLLSLLVDNRFNHFRPDWVLLFLFVSLILLSAINLVTVSNLAFYGQKKFGFLILMSFFPIIATFWFNDHKLLTEFSIFGLFFSTLLSFLTIAAYFLGHKSTLAHRYTFIEGWTPILSAFFSGIGILIVWWLWHRKIGLFKLIFIPASITLINFVAMFLTGSRGPVLCLLITIVLFPPLKLNLLSMKRIVFISILCIATIGAFLLNPNLSSRQRFERAINKITTEDKRQDTIEKRYDRYSHAFKQIQNNPITGIGIGKTPEGHYAHNAILETWEELGIAGLIFMLALLILSAKRLIAIRFYTQDHPDTYHLYLWGSIFFYSFLESMISGTIFGNTIFWISLGLCNYAQKA